MIIAIPDPSLVLVVGTSSSGKSTFAQRHFRPTQVLSSDHYRGVVSDDENDQGATADAFAVLEFIADRRLAGGRLTVIDATNLHARDRASVLAIARSRGVPAVAIVFDVPESVIQERNRVRPDRRLPEEALHAQRRALDAALAELGTEGYQGVWVLDAESVEGVVVTESRVTRTDP
jgi:protein phosphatase